jgi:GTP-binding protein Era
VSEATRAGFAALIGAPNAGKSTLVNALTGAKVSIVSRKAQTTRAPARGVVLEGDSQIVLVDTPGLFAPKRRLDRAMVTAAWGGAGEADVVCVIVDARRGLVDEVRAIVGRLGELRAPKFLVLNKVDLIERERLLTLAAEANGLARFDHTFMISALTGDGVGALRAALAAAMPAGPWLYPEDQLTDGNLRSLAAEITREKLFERLHDELPYQLTVETEQWKEQKDGAVRIEQTIYVTREAHKKIVIGEGGRVLKTVGSLARKEIAAEAGQPVHLFLFVKVRENWLDDPERYREMGLDFPKE